MAFQAAMGLAALAQRAPAKKSAFGASLGGLSSGDESSDDPSPSLPLDSVLQERRRQFIDLARRGNPMLSQGAATILADQQIRLALQTVRRRS